MAAKMAVYYKKYKKISLKPANSRDLMQKLILLILELQKSSLLHPSDAANALLRI